MNFSVHQSKGRLTVAITRVRDSIGRCCASRALTAVLMDFKPDLPHPLSELSGLSSSKSIKGNWAIVNRFICFALAWSLDSLF